jgi:hypothetical protein
MLLHVRHKLPINAETAGWTESVLNERGRRRRASGLRGTPRHPDGRCCWRRKREHQRTDKRARAYASLWGCGDAMTAMRRFVHDGFANMQMRVCSNAESPLRRFNGTLT